MKRSEAREWAFKLIFESQFHTELTFEEIYSNAENIDGFEKDPYIQTVFEGVQVSWAELDELIGKYSEGWASDRISKTSLSILRLSVYEMKNLDDVPVNVSINEAVELAKKYDDDAAPAFINGILNTLSKAENYK